MTEASRLAMLKTLSRVRIVESESFNDRDPCNCSQPDCVVCTAVCCCDGHGCPICIPCEIPCPPEAPPSPPETTGPEAEISAPEESTKDENEYEFEGGIGVSAVEILPSGIVRPVVPRPFVQRVHRLPFIDGQRSTFIESWSMKEWSFSLLCVTGDIRLSDAAPVYSTNGGDAALLLIGWMGGELAWARVVGRTPVNASVTASFAPSITRTFDGTNEVERFDFVIAISSSERWFRFTDPIDISTIRPIDMITASPVENNIAPTGANTASAQVAEKYTAATGLAAPTNPYSLPSVYEVDQMLSGAVQPANNSPAAALRAVNRMNQYNSLPVNGAGPTGRVRPVPKGTVILAASESGLISRVVRAWSPSTSRPFLVSTDNGIVLFTVSTATSLGRLFDPERIVEERMAVPGPSRPTPVRVIAEDGTLSSMTRGDGFVIGMTTGIGSGVGFGANGAFPGQNVSARTDGSLNDAISALAFPETTPRGRAIRQRLASVGKSDLIREMSEERAAALNSIGSEGTFVVMMAMRESFGWESISLLSLSGVRVGSFMEIVGVTETTLALNVLNGEFSFLSTIPARPFNTTRGVFPRVHRINVATKSLASTLPVGWLVTSLARSGGNDIIMASPRPVPSTTGIPLPCPHRRYALIAAFSAGSMIWARPLRWMSAVGLIESEEPRPLVQTMDDGMVSIVLTTRNAPFVQPTIRDEWVSTGPLFQRTTRTERERSPKWRESQAWEFLNDRVGCCDLCVSRDGDTNSAFIARFEGSSGRQLGSLTIVGIQALRQRVTVTRNGTVFGSTGARNGLQVFSGTDSVVSLQSPLRPILNSNTDVSTAFIVKIGNSFPNFMGLASAVEGRVTVFWPGDTAPNLFDALPGWVVSVSPLGVATATEGPRADWPMIGIVIGAGRIRIIMRTQI